jgi:hypothetical protein
VTLFSKAVLVVHAKTIVVYENAEASKCQAVGSHNAGPLKNGGLREGLTLKEGRAGFIGYRKIGWLLGISP